jgi:hypothetical protein
MLFDAIVRDADREIIRPVFERRVRYLYNRSRQWAEPLPDQPRDVWELEATRATLHLEVAEGAAVLDNIRDARFEIQIAVPHLHELRMPYGVALQRAFVADHGSLARHGDDVLDEWRALIERSSGPASERTENPAMSRVGDVPQQWAYYGLCLALEEPSSRFEMSAEIVATTLRAWRLVPMGRMRFPMDQWLFIIEYCRDARRTKGDVYERTGAVVEILSKQIVALLRALQYASVNTYLWRRVLAPAPWFDFDVALLVAAVLDAPGPLSDGLGKVVASAVPSDAADYTTQFVDTVWQLMARKRLTR